MFAFIFVVGLGFDGPGQPIVVTARVLPPIWNPFFNKLDNLFSKL